jgi:hypothetical protein
MVKTLNTPLKSLNSQSKDSSHLNQLKTIFTLFVSFKVCFDVFITV